MRDRTVILAGLALCLGLLTWPAWRTLAAPPPAAAGARAPRERHRVRGAHRLHARVAHGAAATTGARRWCGRARAPTGRQAGRDVQMSLTGTCIRACHTDKAKFCDRCHDYAQREADLLELPRLGQRQLTDVAAAVTPTPLGGCRTACRPLPLPAPAAARRRPMTSRRLFLRMAGTAAAATAAGGARSAAARRPRRAAAWRSPSTSAAASRRTAAARASTRATAPTTCPTSPSRRTR